MTSSVCELLTFSNDLLHGDLVPPDSEGSPDEISARMTGPGAAASSSRTRPGADQLPTRIKELPHVVKMTGARGTFGFTFTHSKKTKEPFPASRLVIALI